MLSTPILDLSFPFELANLSPIDRAYQLLLARGFLVDKIEDHLILSDNAMIKTKYDSYRGHKGERPDDLSYFIDTVQKFNLGEIDIQGRFTPNGIWSIAVVNHLFSPRHFREETSIDRWAGKWTVFTRLTGKKLPLYQLDSRIAILVKALSAVGCRTITSCHGSRTRPAYIQFASTDHHSWFNLLIDKVTSNSCTTFDTKVSPCSIYFHPRASETMRDVWSALIDLGLKIYSQRIELRTYKSTTLELCEHKSLKSFPPLSSTSH